jgi:flagellar basal body-associated protein FliL
MMERKGLEAPTTMVIIIIFLVSIALVVLFILFFSGKANESTSAFTNVTDWVGKFKWTT